MSSIVTDKDTIFVDELIRENARLTVQAEAGQQYRRELEEAVSQLKQKNDALASRAELAEGDLELVKAGLEREKVLAAKLDQVIQDLHFVMAGGDVCKVCKNKCLMGTADCKPRWKGLDD